MKLLGFEGHEIVSMNYEIINNEELQELIAKYEWELSSEANVFMNEEVEIKVTSKLDKTLLSGKVLVVETEGLRKISVKIIGEFTFDNEGESNPKIISDEIYKELWPMLRKYINPAISTITSITTLGELNLES